MVNRVARLCILLAAVSVAGVYLVGSGRVESEIAIAEPFRSGQVIVELVPGSVLGNVALPAETTLIRRLKGTDFYLLQVNTGFEAFSVDELKKDHSVSDASLNRVVHNPLASQSHSIISYPENLAETGLSSNDYSRQAQALDQMLSLTATHRRSSGAGTIVAVVDTGVDRTHPVLAPQLWVDGREDGDIPNNQIDEDLDELLNDTYGWNFVDDNNNPNELPGSNQAPVAGHGTFIAGLIALLAPGCRIMPIRAFSPQGESDEFTVAQAIIWAADHGANVINMSFGTPENSKIMQAAIDYAYQQGIVLAAAMGNQATQSPPLYPAHDYTKVMGVAALDASDQIAYFSNYGANTSMSALGEDIVSTYPGSGYARWRGTSFSTPLVAAEAALLIGADKNSQITRKAIELTALNIDELNGHFVGLIGKGRLRPLNALMALNSAGWNPTVDLHSRVELTATPVFPKARGRAEIWWTGSLQELYINAHNLIPNSNYHLVINGQTQPASCAAGLLGNINLVMTNNLVVNPPQLPDTLLPVSRIDSIELWDLQGRLVLSGNFEPVSGLTKPKQTLLKEARMSTPATLAAVMKEALTGSSGIITVPAAPATLNGMARIEVDSTREVLSLSLDTAASNSTYRIFVDGLSLGSLSSQSGLLSGSYSSDGSTGGSLPQAIKPLSKVRQIIVLDSAGNIVAQGTFNVVGADLGTG